MKRLSPLEAFLHVLCKYLRDRSRIVFGLAEAAGQSKLTISLYGLWHRHRYWETGYRRFFDVVHQVIEDDELLQRLRDIGVEEIVLDNEDSYIVVDIDKIRRSLRC